MHSSTSPVVYGLEVFVEEAILVPDPVGRKHVDESIEKREHHVAQKVSPLSNRTRDESCRGRSEAGFEEKVCIFIPHCIGVIRVGEKVPQAHESIERCTSEADPVAEHPVGQST